MDNSFTNKEYCSEEDANVKLFYNSFAEKTADEWYKIDILVPTIEEFLSLLPGRPRVLDLGCGPGYESMRLEDRGAEVVGIDFCEENVRIARERCPQCRFELMDFRELDSRYGKFDGVFASASLIHIAPDDLNNVMNNISNVLNNGGYLLVIVQDGEGIKESEVTLEGGAQLRRIIYQYSKEKISKAAGNYGLKYIKNGYLDKESCKYNWQCYIFNKQEEESGMESSNKFKCAEPDSIKNRYNYLIHLNQVKSDV
jgi:SAM-dependent methyltransferase